MAACQQVFCKGILAGGFAYAGLFVLAFFCEDVVRLHHFRQFLHAGDLSPNPAILELIGRIRSQPFRQMSACPGKSLDDQIFDDVKILLLRHGQGFHQTGGSDPDPLLTSAGKAQAASWASSLAKAKKFGGPANLVLVSPLRRTIQTACLAFQKQESCKRMEMCRYARELSWNNYIENEMGDLRSAQTLLDSMGTRGQELQETVQPVFIESAEPFPDNDEASVKALERYLKQRAKSLLLQKNADDVPMERPIIIGVVCHWGVIQALCGANPENCEIAECKFAKERSNSMVSWWKRKHFLELVHTHKAPGGPRTG